MEEKMRVMTIDQLMRLPRTELYALAARISARLATYRQGSPQRIVGQISLRNIQIVLAQRGPSP
jgi:hypothetical protein